MNQNNWQVSALRFTAFPQPDFEIDNLWWNKLIGEAPEEDKSEPRRSLRQLKAKWQNGALVLNILPNRIDWIYNAIEDDETIDLAVLGNLDETFEIFNSLIVQWLQLDTSPNMTRMAFGGIFHEHVGDLQEGLKLLQKRYLPFDPKFDVDTSDFLYQINRRRASSQFKALMINRLSKWSIANIQTLQVAPVMKTVANIYALRLELDVNTAQEYSENIPPSNAITILNELFNLATEITNKGDIA